MMGKNIMSMLGRTDPAGDASAAGSSADPGKQGKLSVAELFHLAQGKELPSMPVMSSKQKEDVEETAEQKMQREVLKMASNFSMWMAASKAGQPGMPPGSRFPGYQATAPYGGVPPAAFGMPRPGMMGRGSAQDQMYAEAYAQAMMGVGRGGFPGGGRGGPKGAAAQAQWQAAMGAGYQFPRGPGYGSQPYGGYPPDYSQMARGAGGFDGSNAQGYNAQAAAMHGMYSGLGAPEGPRASAKASASSPEKGSSRVGGAYNQAPAASAPLPAVGTAGTTAASTGIDGAGAAPATEKSGHEEAAPTDEEAGCSQS